MHTDIFLSKPGFICGSGNSHDTEKFIENFATGNRAPTSGVGGITKIDCSLVGEEGVKSFFVGKIDDSLLKPTGDRFDMRVLQILDFALSSVKNTVDSAISRYGAKKVGVCIGSCDNGSELSFKGHKTFFTESKFPDDYDLKIQGADYVATFAKNRLGTKGISLAFSTACSSSASAIIKAKELILAGVCDAVVAGGVDVASDTVLLGFDSLEAVSHQKTNPFSKNRDGINLGEGAGLFVLSRDDLDETGIILAGTGESSDASHMTAPLADGTGAEQAMKAALTSANLNPGEIDYINLHGTGTHLNDSMEARGVALTFGSSEERKLPPCSSTKPLMGHTLGAAASLELAVCFYAIKAQKLPVHVWDGVQDEEIPALNFVENATARESQIHCCMSNSFAFGGCNASLIIKKK